MLCHFFVRKWQSNVIYKNVNNLCVCVCTCVYIYERDREKEREIFLPFSIVFIIKNKVHVFVFHLNDMESLPKFCFSVVVRKICKTSSEYIFQVWNGRIKANNYAEIHWLYISKMQNVTLKAGLCHSYLVGFVCL